MFNLRQEVGWNAFFKKHSTYVLLKAGMAGRKIQLIFPLVLISNSAVFVVLCLKLDSNTKSCCSLNSWHQWHKTIGKTYWQKLMRLEHTCSPRPRCRWLTGASPRQSSWQTEWDQWLLPGVQDFSPLPGFVPSHTGADTNNTIVLICNKNKMANEPWGENNNFQKDSN